MKNRKDRLKDYPDAAGALLNWLESQDITPVDSVPVLAIAMSAVLCSLAHNRPIGDERIRITLDLIHKTIKSMEKMK